MTRKILGYSYAMVAATLALAPYAGWIYGAAAVGLGGWFLSRPTACTPRCARTAPTPSLLSPCACSTSIAYLTLLFVVLAIAALLPVGHW